MNKVLCGIKTWFISVKESVAKALNSAKALFSDANCKVTASMLLPGLGQLLYKRFSRGILYLLASALLIAYFIVRGAADIFGFFTLGDIEGNAWFGIEGDNSVVMLIMGILAILALVLYIAIYVANIKDAYSLQKTEEAGKALPTLKDDIGDLFDKSFYKVALALPVLGVCIFSILPIVFMILIAFTNYGGDIIPPKLVDWVGFENFGKILTLGQFAPTFFKIFGWNMVWALLSTGINYFAGLGLALLLNKKCVKAKAIWRAFPVLAYAIPGFITLLGFKFMFSYGGPINYYIQQMGGEAIGFLGIDSTYIARIIGLLVNAWISVPSIMLMATGILSNINTDLYEAAEIDGANAWHIFVKITLPYVVFATTPVLISQFIGNFNNFGIFYFLRGGLYSEGYFLASDTDLLINWLYNMSIDNNYYSIGAAISLIIFIITSVISLAVYVMSPSYKQEETYR
ncbi:MAG: carbohydrate ABC transporter permease [Eubacteriales bacterium]